MLLNSTRTLLLTYGRLLFAPGREGRQSRLAKGVSAWTVAAEGEKGGQLSPAPESTSCCGAAEVNEIKERDTKTCRQASSAGHNDLGLQEKEKSSGDESAFSSLGLNEEKRRALTLVLDGAPLFIGGGAGVGKSYMIQSIVTALRAKDLDVVVTASTGIAALNIGGSTFHSTFGVRVTSVDNSETNESCAVSILRYSKSLLAKVDVIVVDEVSLLHARHLEGLDIAARGAPGRIPRLPFGGIQVILCGDFMQLMHSTENCTSQDGGGDAGSKIGYRGDETTENTAGQNRSDASSTAAVTDQGHIMSAVKNICVGERQRTSSGLIFESPLFLTCLLHLQLCEVKRHGDTAFLNDLNKLRQGVLTRRMMRSALVNPEDPNAIQLYPTRRSVAAFNESKMLELDGEEHLFRSIVESAGLSGPKGHASPNSRGANDVDGCNDVVVLHFLEKMRSSRRWQREVKKFVGQICTRCGISGIATSVVAPPYSLRQPYLKVYVHFCVSKQYDCLYPVAKMKAEWERSYYGTTPESKSARMFFGRVLFEVKHKDSLSTFLRASLQQAYSKVIESDNVLQSKRLKVGCRVILLRNLSNEYVNGSTGTVIGFQPVNKSRHLFPKGIRTQLSRKVYASLSRKPVVSSDSSAGSSENSYGGNGKEQALDVVNYDDVIVPIVRMDADGKDVAIPWLSLPLPDLQDRVFCTARVVTMPLVPAYAFTVHKTQGLTLDHSILLDCKGFFPCNHIIYVAASRVKKFSQLRMINVSPRMVTVHPGALHFSSSLPNVAEAETKWKKWKELQRMVNNGKALSASNPSVLELALYCATWKHHK